MPSMWTMPDYRTFPTPTSLSRRHTNKLYFFLFSLCVSITATIDYLFCHTTANKSCYFVGDGPIGDPNITKILPSDEETAMLSWEHSEVVEIHRRRYMLKNNALEVFLVTGKTMLLSFDATKVQRAVGRGEGGGVMLCHNFDMAQVNYRLRGFDTTMIFSERCYLHFLMVCGCVCRN